MARPKNHKHAHKPRRSPRLANPNKPAEDGTCHFFKLPPELRLDIYDLAFTDLTIDTSKQVAGERITPPLLHTNKLIRREAIKPYIDKLISCLRDSLDESLESLRLQSTEFREAEAKLEDGGHSMEELGEAMEITTNLLNEELEKVEGIIKAEIEAMEKEMRGAEMAEAEVGRE